MEYNIFLSEGYARIDFENKDISGDFKSSPNGIYHIISSEISSELDNFSDDKEYVLVFTDKNVLYKKAIPNNNTAEMLFVFDNASSIVVTEEEIISYNSTGTQKIKKLPDVEESGVCGSVFWCVGTNDDSKKVLFLYDLSSLKAITKVLPDIEYNDKEKEDQLSSEANFHFKDNKFIFIYENEIDFLAYDLNGNEITVSTEEIRYINDLVKESERKNKIESANKEYSYWSNRLVSDEKQRKPNSEIEYARSKVEYYEKKLLELGIDVPHKVLKDESQKQSIKKEGVFTKLFGKFFDI